MRQFATSHLNNGGILLPDDIDEKAGCPVIDTLCNKHPDLQQPNLNDSSSKSFKKYEECPDILSLDVTGDGVAEMAPKLKGAAGPTSVDAVAFFLASLLRFGIQK